MLTISNLSKSFGAHKVLDNINLFIESERIVGLTGPSGGGKSTLLRLIQQLESPDTGTITCDGRTGFVFQDFQLFPHMTVLQNVEYAPKIQKYPDTPNRAMELLTALELYDKAHAYPGQLSGGQKQRVALVRCLMMRPDILLCDEPTSGLDNISTQAVANLLKEVRSMGVCMLIASHDSAFLALIANRIIAIDGGRVVSDRPNFAD